MKLNNENFIFSLLPPSHPLFSRTVPLSSGSGFVMSETGLIVTNAHVVSSTTPVSGHQQLKVQMCGGDVYEATIKDIDKKSDIATIKINPQVRPNSYYCSLRPVFIIQKSKCVYSTTSFDPFGRKSWLFYYWVTRQTCARVSLWLLSAARLPCRTQ